MPNMIVFSQRAWSEKEPWIDEKTAEAQEPLLNISWNILVNSIGQRHLPLLLDLYGGIAFDLPKPGAIVDKGKLIVRQQFPGLNIHYTLDGKIPNTQSLKYTEPIKIPESSVVTLRIFDSQGRGGNSIQIK